jgi:hypothetical protein
LSLCSLLLYCLRSSTIHILTRTNSNFCNLCDLRKIARVEDITSDCAFRRNIKLKMKMQDPTNQKLAIQVDELRSRSQAQSLTPLPARLHPISSYPSRQRPDRFLNTSQVSTSISDFHVHLSVSVHTIPYQKRWLVSRAARNKNISVRQRHFVAKTVELIEEDYRELRMLMSLLEKGGPFDGLRMDVQLADMLCQLLANMRRLKRWADCGEDKGGSTKTGASRSQF